MKDADVNALRSVAKKVIAEYRERTKGLRDQGEKDKVSKEIIERHYRTIDARYSKIEFCWVIGVVSGQLKDRRAGDV